MCQESEFLLQEVSDSYKQLRETRDISFRGFGHLLATKYNIVLRDVDCWDERRFECDTVRWLLRV